MIHVTLNSGDRRESPRREVDRAAIDVLRPLVHDGQGEIPARPGHTFKLDRVEGAAMYSVYREHTARAPWPHGKAPLVTCGLATTEAAGPQLWKMLRDLHERLYRRAPVARRPRSVPWLGVLLMPGLSLTQKPGQAVDWLGDFERCVAWGP